MEKTVLIAVSNQKGGVGKSTVASAFAGYLYYVMKKNIAVIDCDNGQHSLFRFREREKKIVDKVDVYKEMMMAQWNDLQKKAYPLIASSPKDVMKHIEALLSSDIKYDLIIVDLPGSTTTAGVLSTIINVDYVLTPIVPDRFDMQSSLGFASAVMDYKAAHKNMPLKGFVFFWNRVDRRVSTEIFDAYVKILERLEFPVMDTIIPQLNRYTKEMSYNGKPFFRSTLMPPNEKLIEGSNIDLFAQELCVLLNI